MYLYRCCDNNDDDCKLIPFNAVTKYHGGIRHANTYFRKCIFVIGRRRKEM